MQLAKSLPQGSRGSPRSPLLSDAGMILPDFGDDALRSESPHPYFERPPSPPTLAAVCGHSRSSSSLGSIPTLSSVPPNRRRVSQHLSSPHPSPASNSSQSTLRKMGDAEGSCSDARPSSPTPHTTSRSTLSSSWNDDERRISVASSSILSEDFENWPGFDNHAGFDDSGVDLEDQEELGQSAGTESNKTGMGRAGGRKSGSDDDDIDDDPYSSAALSRRAEIILANAKQRLNVCATVSWAQLDGC